MSSFSTYKCKGFWLTFLPHILNFIFDNLNSIASKLTVEIKSFFSFILSIDFLQNLLRCFKVDISTMFLSELLKDSLSLFMFWLRAVNLLFHILNLSFFIGVTRQKAPIFRLHNREREFRIRSLIFDLILHRLLSWFRGTFRNLNWFWYGWFIGLTWSRL